MNLSDFQTDPIQREGRNIRGICEETRGGGMPMSIYVPMHPMSKLSSSDVDTLCQWSNGVIAHLPPEAMAPMHPMRGGR